MDSGSSKLVRRIAATGPLLSGHAACVAGDGEVYMFGGTHWKEKFNGLWRFDFEGGSWEAVEVRAGKPPPVRCFHGMCACRVDKDDLLVIFGGLGEENKRFNDTWTFNVRTKTWCELATTGAGPSVRSHMALTVYGGNRVVVFGGCNPHPLDDLYILQLGDSSGTEATWIRPISQGQQPSGRLASRSVTWRHSMILFGGYDGKNRFNDVYALDFRNMQWSKLLCVGNFPPKQYGGTTHMINDFMVIMPGNLGFDSAPVSQLYVLDLVALEWKVIELRDAGVASSHPYHAGCCRDTQILIHGGYESTASDESRTATFLFDLSSVRFLSWSFDASAELVSRNLETLSKEGSLAQGTIDSLRALLAQVQAEEARLHEKMREREETLRAMQAAFVAEKELLRVMETNASTRVTLDVGGTIYKTTVATLIKCEGSMLSAMFSGRYKYDQENVFIDRDGRNFIYILNHLRDYPTANLPDDPVSLRELLSEAKFFLLPVLESAIREKLKLQELKKIKKTGGEN